MSRHPLIQTGFTLVELMVALLIGLLVSGAAVLIVINAMGQMRNTQSFAELIDNGRVVLAMMGNDLTHSGFMGDMSGQALVLGSNITLENISVGNDCSGDGLNNSTVPNAVAATFRTIWGETVSSASTMGCIDDAVVGTDLIQVKRFIGRNVTDNTALYANRVFAVSNATGMVLFNSNDGLNAAEPPGAFYFEYQHRVYYIRNVSRYNQAFPVLMRMTLRASGSAESMVQEEIAEGVQDIRILYGIDDDGNAAADRYVTAAQVSDDEWDNIDPTRIVSVQLALLMRAIDPDQKFQATNAITYNYAGESYSAPDDGIRRKVLSTTFSLRNYQIANGL